MYARPTSSRRLRLATTVCAAGAIAGMGIAFHPATPSSAAGTELIVARDITDGKTMDPGKFYEFTANAMATNCYDTLVTFKGTNTAKPVPDLATSWTVSNGGKTFTFHLRHGVRFASGNPMTADDVVFSYRRLKALNGNPEFLIDGATSITAPDKYTVRIVLKAPDVSFLAALADNNFGVLDSKVVRAHGGVDTPDAATKDKAETFLDHQSAGTGAFQMIEWTRNTRIVLTRNPYYWGPKPSLTKITFQNEQSPATERLLVQRGQVDVASDIDLQLAQSLKNDPSVQVVTGNTLDLIYVGMTLSPKLNKALSNKLVRQAVRYAIDYNGILKGLLKGVGTRPNSMIPVGMLGNSVATNNELLIQQNVAKARALLKQAGYPHGFSVKLSYHPNYAFDGVLIEPLANKIQNDLAKVGIKVTLDPEQDSVLLSAYRAQKLQMILYNWGVDFPDPNDYAGPFSFGSGPAHRVYYSVDQTMQNEIIKADSISDASQRAAIYKKVQQNWLDNGPWIGLVQPQNIIVFGKDVKGYQYSPILPNNFRNISL